VYSDGKMLPPLIPRENQLRQRLAPASIHGSVGRGAARKKTKSDDQICPAIALLETEDALQEGATAPVRDNKKPMKPPDSRQGS
jgi:hypothetical protein